MLYPACLSRSCAIAKEPTGAGRVAESFGRSLMEEFNPCCYKPSLQHLNYLQTGFCDHI
jgi:hypothetical protein